MRKLFTCGLILAALLLPSLAAPTARSLTVSVDRGSEGRYDLKLLNDQVNQAYDAQKRLVDVHWTFDGTEMVVGDVEKDEDAVVALSQKLADESGFTISKNRARTFWFYRMAAEDGPAQDYFERNTRLEDTIRRLWPPAPGVAIEADGDGVVVRCSAPGFSEFLYEKTRTILAIEPVSAGVWRATWDSEGSEWSKFTSVDKALAALLRPQFDLLIQQMRDSAIFVADDTPGNAAFFAAIRGAFVSDPSYTLRETAALKFRYKSKVAVGPFPSLNDEMKADRTAREFAEAISPAIKTDIAGDHLQVQAVTQNRTAERMAVVRKLLENRNDLVITEGADHGLDIRLKPGMHLLTPIPPVDGARLAEILRERAAALKLGPVKVANAGPERAVITFATDAGAAAFRQSISYGARLTMRLVDEEVDRLDPKPGPGGECLNASYGPPVCLKPGAILTSDMVAEAKAESDDSIGQAVIIIRLTGEGRKLFAATTSAHVNERIAIVVDGVVMTAPVVREPIEGGSVQIQGNFTLQEAAELAARIVPVQGEVPLRIGF